MSLQKCFGQTSGCVVVLVGVLLFVNFNLVVHAKPQNNDGDEKTLKNRQLPPDLYDIWANQKEKIYLSGIWKIKKLDNTISNPSDDPGTVAGFWKKEHADQDWDPVLVPWDINLPYPPPSHRRMRPATGFNGVFWYRHEIDIPAVKNKRALIFFGDIANEAAVFINGKKVGSHQNTFTGALARGENYQAFTLDITEAFRFGEKNTIAIRCFGLADRQKTKQPVKGSIHATLKGDTQNERLGIWLPCWIELVPELYLEKALLTPQLGSSVVQSKLRIMNTIGRPQAIKLRAVFSAYESARYKPSSRPIPQTVDLGEFKLQLGLNEFKVQIPMKDPILWWPDDPFLYQVDFEAQGDTLGTSYTSIGKERFGFREFKVQGDQFLLNGKKWYLPGIQPVELPYLLVRPDYAANYDNYLGTLFKNQRAVNIAFIRPHSGHYPWPYQDIADETGMLIHAERYDPCELDDRGQPTLAYRKKIQESLEAYWNHPSVVMYSLGNEIWDKADWKPAGMLNVLYDLYKQIDPTRPCGGSSGRPAHDERTRCDYYDSHIYVGIYNGPVTHTAEVMEEGAQAYYQRWWGKKPFINGECAYISWHRSPEMDQLLGAPRPEHLDKAAYVQIMQTPILRVFPRINFVGIRNQLNFEATQDAMIALFFKRYIEQYRYAEHCRGFNLHQSPYHSIPGPTQGPIFETFRSACSPFWLGLANTDRNFYRGKTIDLELLAVNDSRFNVNKATVQIRLTGSDGTTLSKKSIAVPNLDNGQRAKFKVSLDLPAKVLDYRYVLKLDTLGKDQKQIHQNEYSIHLVDPSSIKPIRQKELKVAYYGGSSKTQETVRVLKNLGVNYTPISSFNDLTQFKMLILGTEAVDDTVRQQGKLILDWITQGGKLLCLEQKNIGPLPWAPTVQISPAGLYDTGSIMVDIIDDRHPVFQGFQWSDFDLWNGWRGQICDFYITPLSEAVLASAMYQRATHTVGMAAAEFGIGKGVCYLSQIEAVKRLGKDPMASLYLTRLLNYVLGDWKPATIQKIASKSLFTPPDPKNTQPIDLQKVANGKRMSDGKAPTPRIWVLGSSNDLEDLPAGKMVLQGVPFEILKASQPSCVVVGPTASGLSPKIEIPLGSRVKRIFFLMAAAGVTDPMIQAKEKIGTLRIHFGLDALVSVEDIPLTLGENILPFDKADTPLNSGFLAWSTFQEGHYRGPDQKVGASILVWENPSTEISIDGISLLAAKAGAPVLLAVTFEK